MDREQIKSDLYRHMLEKREILLTVRVNTEQDAAQIFEWMYAQEKPMSAELCQIAWDQRPVSIEIADAVETLKSVLLSQ